MQLRALLGASCPLAAVVLLLAACGPPSPPPPIVVEAPADVLEPAAWEREFAPAEFVVHREGRILAPAAGDGNGDDGEERDDEARRGVAGVRVELLAARPGGRPPLTVVATVETDADGRFRVGPGPANHWALRASLDGWRTTVGGRDVDFPGTTPLRAGGPVELHLRPAVTRTGRMLDAAGAPLPDEPVAAFGEAYREEVRTDSDGQFVIHPPAELIRVEATGEAFSRWQAEFDASTGEDLELRPSRRGVVRGTVIESQTGRLLANALVAWDGLPHVHTRTDAEGRFELPEPRGRQFGAGYEGRLAAFASGWGWRSITLPLAGAVQIRLSRGTGAAGRALDAEGEPVAGARIIALSPSWDRNVELVRGPLTAADGTFELDWLPRPPRGARDPLMLVAHRRGLGITDAVRCPADGPPLELVFPGERVVRGRMARESSAGSAGSPLEVRWREWGLTPAAAARLPRMALVEGGTDAEGGFEMHGVPLHREARLRAFVDGGFVDKVLPPGDTTPVSLVLEGGGVLTGRLVDTDGEVLDVTGRVIALATDHPVFTHVERAVALVDGTFRIEDLPDAEYVVSVDAAGFSIQSQRARVGDDVPLVAERFARLVFRTVFPLGAEPEPIAVRFTRDGSAGGGTRVRVPGDTRTLSRAVQAGLFDVDASGGVWRAVALDVRVAEGEERVVELRLERTLRLRARLFEADGSPLPGTRVRFFPLDDRTRRPEAHTSDREGWVAITGLTPGAWEARVVLVNRAPLRRAIRVTAGSEELELRLPPHGDLRIEVLDGNGEPAQGAALDLSAQDGTPVNAWGEGAHQLGSRFRCDDAGRALVRGVGVGRVVVTARRGTLQLGRVEADVVAGETIEVTMN